MYIQIDGIFYPNKGDQLMLYSIIDKFRTLNNHNYEIIYGKGKGAANPKKLRCTGLLQLVYFRRYKFQFEKFLSRKQLYNYGLIKEDEVNAIIDSGGFQFGDQWDSMYSNKHIKYLNDYYKRYKKRNGTIIFLPQAFGPFTTKKSRKIITIIYKYADLIFARDTNSYNHLTSMFGFSEKVKKSPDFTVEYNPIEFIDKTLNEFQDYVIIIPNKKMVSHTDQITSANYIPFLKNIAKHLIERGDNIIFINHEGQKDLEIIHDINEDIDNKGIVLDNINTKDVKLLISKAKYLISSRYHGVVSGLNQGILTFCTSWSHKYFELMNDFQCTQNILDVNNTKQAISIINRLSQKIDNKSNNNKLYMKETEQMWQTVFQTLQHQ